MCLVRVFTLFFAFSRIVRAWGGGGGVCVLVVDFLLVRGGGGGWRILLLCFALFSLFFVMDFFLRKRISE